MGRRPKPPAEFQDDIHSARLKADGEQILLRLERLRTVRQLADEYPHLFTEASLRWTIFRRKENGFDTCIVRIGRRLLIDTDRLRVWLANHRGGDLPEPRAASTRSRPSPNKRKAWQ